jgi:hypothetical protein
MLSIFKPAPHGRVCQRQKLIRYTAVCVGKFSWDLLRVRGVLPCT